MILVVLFCLGGVAYCGFQVGDAWRGGGAIPLGAILGGSIDGLSGAMAGSALVGDSRSKRQSYPNWVGLVFWAFVMLVWMGMLLGAVTGALA